MNEGEEKPVSAAVVDSDKNGAREGSIHPSPAASQNRLDLAMKFLNNPRVMSYPMESRRAFLRKKGWFSLVCIMWLKRV